MKKHEIVSLLLAVLLVWLAAGPALWLILLVDPPTVAEEFAEFGAAVPSLSEPWIHYITFGRTIVLCLLSTAFAVILHGLTRDAERRALTRLIYLAVWHILMGWIFLVAFLPCFKMAHVTVADPGVHSRHDVRQVSPEAAPGAPPNESLP